MTTNKFIEKIPKELRLHPLGHCKPLSELVLDPKVWEAVGKVEGWGEICEACKKIDDGNPCKQLSGQDPLTHIIMEPGDKMHKMIDSLIQGRTIEQYIKTL